MVKCRSLAAAAVGALLLFPGVSAAQSFEAAFEAAVAEAGFPDLPDFSSAAADAGFGDIEAQRATLLASFEEEVGEAERMLEEALDAAERTLEETLDEAARHFEELLAELLAQRDELAATEPGPGDFVLENKPGGVINCTNGVCETPAD